MNNFAGAEQVVIPDQQDLEAAFASAERDQEFQKFLGDRGVSVVRHEELLNMAAAKKEFDAMKTLDDLFSSNPHLDHFVDAVDTKLGLSLSERPAVEVSNMVGKLAGSKEYGKFVKQYEKTAAEQKKLAEKAEKEAAKEAAKANKQAANQLSQTVKAPVVPRVITPLPETKQPEVPVIKRKSLPVIPKIAPSEEKEETPAFKQNDELKNVPVQGAGEVGQFGKVVYRSAALRIKQIAELSPQQKLRLIAGVTAVAAVVTPVASYAAQMINTTEPAPTNSVPEILSLDKKADSPEEQKAMEVAATFSALADPDPEVAVEKQLEFVNGVIENSKDMENVLERKSNSSEVKLITDFLNLAVDGMTVQLKTDESPAVQQNVDNIAKLTKHLVMHPDALRGAEAAGVARPQNEFQQKFTEYYTDVIDVEAVYTKDEVNLIWGSFAKAYDVSSTPEEEAKILEVASAEVDRRREQDNELREAVEPNLEVGEVVDNPELHEAEAGAANKAFSVRVADLVGQAAGGKWGDGRPIKPLDAPTLEKILNETDARYNHPIFGRKVALAQLFQESKFDPSAGSHAGAQGIAQFMPGTWPSWSNGKDVNDPAAAIDAQFRFMIALTELMQKRFPEKPAPEILQLALAGYNAGPNNDAVEEGRVPQNGETNVYVDTITNILIKTSNQMKDAAREVRITTMQCPQGVVDLGVHQGGYEGRSRSVRLCAIPGLESSSDTSRPGHKYYVNGSEGRAMVDIEIAEKVLALVQAAEKDGVDLRAVSSFRTWEHQQVLWNANPNPSVVAPPGKSNHQSGNAVDFEMDGMPIQADHYKTQNGGKASKDNPRVAPESKTWNWLKANAEKFGLVQYWNEPWHWSPTGH